MRLLLIVVNDGVLLASDPLHLVDDKLIKSRSTYCGNKRSYFLW